jgi:hypothetical protein
MNPGITHFHALFANMRVGLPDFDLIEVSAFLWHQSLQCVHVVPYCGRLANLHVTLDHRIPLRTLQLLTSRRRKSSSFQVTFVT